MPLLSNQTSIRVINEHKGLVFFTKWNPNKRILASGGAGDCYVDLWDYNQNANEPMNPPLRHYSNADDEPRPDRSDESHYITSIQWNHSGDSLLTSAYDNVARVWDSKGSIKGLFKCENNLICSSWSKNDQLVASGGENTNVLVWNPNIINKDPVYTFSQEGTILDIAWQNDR